MMDFAEGLLPVPLGSIPPPDIFEAEIDDEISPLEYARLNGLARDYLADQLVFSELAKLQTAVQRDLAHDSDLQQFDFGNEFKVEERVTISKEGAILLSSIAQAETCEEIDVLTLPLLKTRSLLKRAKLELPLLKTDHETDCRNFARSEDFEIKLCDIKLPLEMVIEENNEGLVWPSKFSCLGAEVLETLKQEKISVSKDDMVYLQAALKHDWTEEDDRNLWRSEQKYKRSTALEPVTPPLSPLPTPIEPYEPSMSDPAFQLPVLSDASSPTKYVLEAIENKIFEQDVPTPLRKPSTIKLPDETSSDTYAGDGTVALGDIYSPLGDIYSPLGDIYSPLGDIYSPLASLDNAETPPSIQIQRMRREDLKVEEPLTPVIPQAVPKSVHFSNIVEEMELYPFSGSNSPSYGNKFFEEAFGEALKTANQRSEQERLIEADSTARVDVPDMDFSKPDPPWKALQQRRGSANLLARQKLTIQQFVGQQQPWSGSALVAAQLNWVPFPPDLGKVALEETLEADESIWEAFVNGPRENEVIDSSNLTWKPPGLRIVNDEEDGDDEIEPGKFLKDGVQDLCSLIKKRKMALDQNQTQESRDPTNNALGMGQVRRNTLNAQLSTSNKVNVDDTRGQEFGILGGAFSALNSINNYLELRGTKKPKLMDSSYFQQPDHPASQSLPKPQTAQIGPKTQTTIQLPIRKSPVEKIAPLPAPTIQSSPTKSCIIVSSTLLKHRSLIKNLESLLPGLALVERDFSAHNTTTWMPGSVTRSPVKSSLDSEADVIVSPSMGIVITTLQKMKQQPLPGQKTKPAIRERLEQVITRYEKLVVYVSEGRADETTHGLDENDCSAYGSFAGFALGLNSSVTIQFVGGGDDTLSKWLASTIAQNRVMGESMLLEEETHWELFLRRAGMNAFAAQAVVAELKEPDGVNVLSPSKAGLFGLPAFVDLAVEQRVTRFAPLCGRGLIERVSVVIDADWRV